MKTNATILVTGATGFIGTHLVQQLVARGFRVRAVCRREQILPIPGRRNHPFQHVNVQQVKGDVTDQASIAKAVDGCDYLFHVAGLARQWEKDPSHYYQVNQDGVVNVLQAARDAGVKRTVVTSTIVTLGPTIDQQIGNEDMPRNTKDFFTEYEKSKTAGEQAALEFAQAGLPVVIVNPTRVFGPGYLNEGNSVAKLIDDYDRGKIPFLLNGGRNRGNYVFVNDVVNGHILAMEKGRIGERYILGGENASLKEFLNLVDDVSSKTHWRFPMKRIPHLVAWVHEQRAKWLGIYPQITTGWLKTFMAEWAFECAKAKSELGYQPRSLRTGIEKTYHWLMELREHRMPASRRVASWLQSFRKPESV